LVVFSSGLRGDGSGIRGLREAGGLGKEFGALDLEEGGDSDLGAVGTSGGGAPVSTS
jgi:hypothetical protein